MWMLASEEASTSLFGLEKLFYYFEFAFAFITSVAFNYEIAVL